MRGSSPIASTKRTWHPDDLVVAWPARSCAEQEPSVAERIGVPIGPAGPLTRREWEIAGLIARGQTNPQIAAQLVVSRRTVDRHVSNILNKLGFATRGQIGAWTVERRLSATGPTDYPRPWPRPPRPTLQP